MPEPRIKRRQWNIAHHAHELTFSVYHRHRWLGEPAAAQIFLRSLDEARSGLNFDVFAFVVMPEHCHVLLRPRSETYNMGEILQAIKSPTAKAIFAEHPHLRQSCRVERSGRPAEYRFWQAGGGYDRNIFKTRTIWQVIDYIHANPIRRSLCARPCDWPWSSAGAYSGLPTPIQVDLCPWSNDLG